MSRARLRSAAGAVCLAAALVWACADGLRFASERPQERRLAGHSRIGEVLAHGIRARAETVSYRMPLATLVSARVHYHAPARDGTLIAVDRALVVLLLFAIGFLLHPYGGFIAAAAVVALTSPGSDLNLYPDSGYYLLVLLTAGLLAWRARSPSPGRTALLAAAVGATLLWRSPLAFFTPALALYEWGVERRFSLKGYRKQLLILCLVPYLFLLPWIAMNWTIHHRLVIFERGAANSNIVTGALGLVRTIEGDLATLVDEPYDEKSGGAVLAWAAREAARHPLRFVRAYALRTKFALDLHPWLALFAAAGFWAFRKRREHRALAFMAAYYLGVHCFMSVEERYFWPLWPLLALLACSLPASLRSRDEPRAEGPEYRFGSGFLKAALALVIGLTLYAQGTLLSFASQMRRGRGDVEAQLSDALRSSPDDAWLLGERGKVRFGRGDFAGAAGDFSRAAALEPENLNSSLLEARAEALLGRPARLLAWSVPPGRGPGNDQVPIDADILKGLALLRLGRGAEALERLRAAREAFGDRNIVVNGPLGERESLLLGKLRGSDAGFAARCRQLQGPRSPEEAWALNEALGEIEPNSSEVWIKRGALAARLGRREEALRALARAGELRPRPNERLRIAVVYRDLKEYGRASRRLESLSRERPGDAGVWLERAGLAALRGDRDAALEALSRAERLKLTSDEQRRRLLWLLRELKEPRRAAAYLDSLIRLLPRDAELWLERAELTAESGDPDASARALDRASALNPGAAGRARLAAARGRLSGLWLDRAELEAGRGARAAARESAERAAAERPGNDERLRLARLYRTLEDRRGASEALDALAARTPDDPELWLERAGLETENGARAAAFRALARADALLPVDGDRAAELRRRLALAYQDLKAYGRAVELFERLIRRYPAAASFRSDKALCEHLMGEDDAALAGLGIAIRLDPKFLPAYLTLGAVHAARGRYPEAIRVYDAALSKTSAADADPLRPTVSAAREELLSKVAPAVPGGL